MEPFSTGKLERCLWRLLKACQHDVELARPIAEAVAIHLRSWRDAELPSSEYIYRCACAVLMQTGLEHVAAQLTVHREQRQAQPRRPRVVAEGGTSRAWRRERLARTLRERHGLRAAVADMLGRGIEARVTQLGYGVVSATLIDELTRSEMAAWGLLDDWSEREPAQRSASRSRKEM
ncbi:MAG: hypothetical protein KKB50_02645 [Planctomycetes bacterium]|nr:hypothetical protein [Planctomycetota bacterium]